MGKYLLQASYSQQAISGLVQKPEDRTAVLNEMVSSVGGKVISLDYCFGEYDVVAILEAPDDTTMASISMAAGASGAVPMRRSCGPETSDAAVASEGSRSRMTGWRATASRDSHAPIRMLSSRTSMP